MSARMPIDRLAFAQVGDDAGLADAGHDFQTHIAQRVGDDPRRAKFLKAEFGVHVEIAPPGDDLVFESVGVFDEWRCDH